MENLIVVTALYILLVVIAYAPNPTTVANQSKGLTPDLTVPIDYFPTMEEKPQAPSIDLAALSIRELKKLAQGRVKGYSRLTKAQLIQHLEVAPA